MIVKVKEPIESEYPLIKEDQLLFTYFHFASSEELTHAMIGRKADLPGVRNRGKSRPQLAPARPDERSGRKNGHSGRSQIPRKAPWAAGVSCLGGVAGVKPANVLVLGGGIVGTEAAKMAAGLGANVTIVDISLPRLRYLEDIMPANVDTVMSNEYNIRAPHSAFGY